MRTALTLVTFAALSCGEPQPWPMGYWSGETTLVHLETATATTSPIEVVCYYPGYNVGLGVDDPRFVFHGKLPDRGVWVTGQPGPGSVSTFDTRIDGGAFVAVSALAGGGDRLFFDVTWRARDGGSFDPAAPAVFTERASLRRLRDYDWR